LSYGLLFLNGTINIGKLAWGSWRSVLDLGRMGGVVVCMSSSASLWMKLLESSIQPAEGRYWLSCGGACVNHTRGEPRCTM